MKKNKKLVLKKVVTYKGARSENLSLTWFGVGFLSTIILMFNLVGWSNFQRVKAFSQAVLVLIVVILVLEVADYYVRREVKFIEEK